MLLTVEDLDRALSQLNLSDSTNPFQLEMDQATIQSLLSAAVRAATEQTKREFQNQIDTLTNRLSNLETPSTVEEYREITITPNVECNEPLDIVKSLPEFNGDQAHYVSWRQAAHTAYKLFEPYAGSSKHYQAVAIIRNKVTGTADSTLSSFNTVLNFKAIISRLDFTYADKKPIHLIEQQMSTLRQGQLSITQFYDEVERKLTLLLNKTVMMYSNNQEVVKSLNAKHRADALRVFISGLNRPLSDTLFSAQPPDMPSALVLAQELSANHARYQFAASFHNPKKPFVPRLEHQNSPHYRSISKQNPVNPQDGYPQPMEVDPSTSRFRQNQPGPSNQNIMRQLGNNTAPNQQNNFSKRNFVPQQTQNNGNRNQAFQRFQQHPVAKRPYESERAANNNKVQRINFLDNQLQEQISYDPEPQEDWEAYSDNADFDIQETGECNGIIDQINFLGQTHSCQQ